MSDARGDMASRTGPPVGLLVLTGVAVGGSLALVFVVSLAAHVVGYLLSSFLCIGLVLGFAQVDARRRNDPARRYEEHPGSGSGWARPARSR